MTILDPVDYEFLTAEGKKEIKASAALRSAATTESRHVLIDLAQKVATQDPLKADTMVMHLRLRETLALLTMDQAQLQRENEELEHQIRLANRALTDLKSRNQTLRSTLACSA